MTITIRRIKFYQRFESSWRIDRRHPHKIIIKVWIGVALGVALGFSSVWMVLCFPFRLPRGWRMNSKKESYLEVKDKTTQRMIVTAKKRTAKLKRQTTVRWCCCSLNVASLRHMARMVLWRSFCSHVGFAGRTDCLNPPPTPAGVGAIFLSGLSPLNTAWLNLPGAEGLAGISLGIITDTWASPSQQSNMPRVKVRYKQLKCSICILHSAQCRLSDFVRTSKVNTRMWKGILSDSHSCWTAATWNKHLSPLNSLFSSSSDERTVLYSRGQK